MESESYILNYNEKEKDMSANPKHQLFEIWVRVSDTDMESILQYVICCENLYNSKTKPPEPEIHFSNKNPES